MPEPSRMHFYLNWAKERIDEMDATLASLEAKVSQVQADSKVKANQLIADLQKRRDDFQATVKKQAEAGEAAWQSTKPQLGSHWKSTSKRKSKPTLIAWASRSSSSKQHSGTWQPLR